MGMPSNSQESLEFPTLSYPNFLQRRLVGYFGIGFAGTLVAIFLGFFITPFDQPISVFPQGDGWVRAALYFSPTVWAIGLLILFFRSLSETGLYILDLVVTSLFLATMSFILAAIFPGKGILYPYLFLLALRPVVIPFPTRIQAVVTVMALLTLTFSRFESYHLLSETQKLFLTGEATQDFWMNFFGESIFFTLMAGLFLEANRILSRTRRLCEKEGKLGNYVIKRFLGTGGMGKVYLADHLAMCRPAALKILEPGGEELSHAISRFEREVRICSTLTHPNTITIFDYGNYGEFIFFYAMEYLQGQDLQKIVEHFGPLPPHRVVYILKQICGSLEEAHHKGIVHRDIKPSNIFLSYIGGKYDFVKVLDFGLAKEIHSSDEPLTASHMFMGTPAFISPEMAFDRKNVDRRTDIYSLGCVAYWALTGHAPFEGENEGKVLLDHVKALPKWPSEHGIPNIPIELERIILRCLEKQKEDRFPDAKGLRLTLNQVPLAKPWTQTNAKHWWREHFPVLGEAPAEPEPPVVKVLSFQQQAGKYAGILFRRLPFHRSGTRNNRPGK